MKKEDKVRTPKGREGTVIRITKVCDLCGNVFFGKAYPVYDENFNKQIGLISCENCFPITQEP